ncbi:MAG: formate dehydrogenase accessory sulfurtransferase FdhD [Ferruginibacter sp.]|nr:formate dehydrogenase accessory sulfurtransferase FdhD [Ferruginibacter sp.]
MIGLSSKKEVTIQKIIELSSSSITDFVSIEEPLEIRIVYGESSKKIQKNISVTMRTPGNDFELAIGFLFTEGIIANYNNIKNISHQNFNQNIVIVELVDNFEPHLQQADRNFYTTSSCGVCGKPSIESIKIVSIFNAHAKPNLIINAEVFYQLLQKLSTAQNDFSSTGGIHASALFTPNGDLLFLKEDVGRHNALDKLIGKALINNLLPLNQHILLLSGRASFELIQKAAIADIVIIAAIGAPSSLAVELAKEFDITLIGFLKESKFNLYHVGKQVQISFLNEK